MIKRLLHCRCCGQLSPAEYNCCPKYHEALTEITELKKELGYSVCDFTGAQWQDAQTEIAELKAFTKYLFENAQTVWNECLTLEKALELFKCTKEYS